MLQLNSQIKVCDRTGLVMVQCIKVLGARKRKVATIGGVFLSTAKQINVVRLSYIKPRIRKKFQRGTLHRILLLRARFNYQRQAYSHVRFNENAGIVVNRRNVPVSNRLFGPLVREFTGRWPWLACLTRNFV